MLIHWDPSPFAIALGPLEIRWYSLAFLISFVLSLNIMRKMCKAEKLPQDQLDNLLFYVAAGTIIGARMGHCLFYDFEYYYKHPIEILEVWKGGLASHGGALGVIAALAFFSKRYRVYSFSWLLDRISVLAVLSGGFIRLGNLINSEIIGKPTNEDWGFIFTRIDQVPRHPTQIYESLGYFTMFLVEYLIYRRFKFHPPKFLLLGSTLFLVFVFRFFMEFLKENQEPFEKGMILNMGQLLSIPAIAVGGFLLFYSLIKEKKKL